MRKPPQGLAAFERALQAENILLVIRQNEQGLVYGLTYIDQRTRCVFNGSDLGKPYSAKGILQTCRLTPPSQEGKNAAIKPAPVHTPFRTDVPAATWRKEAARQVLEALFQPEQQPMNMPVAPKKRKKKRKKI